MFSRLSPRPLRACLLATASILLAAPAGAALAQAPTAQRQGAIEFDIPAQPLRRSLQRFAEQSRIQVGYAKGVRPDARGAAVKGAHTPAQALSQLLAGTGLDYRFTSATTVIIDKAPDAAGAVQLGALRVEGANGSAGDGSASGVQGIGEGGEGAGGDAVQEAAVYRGAGTSAYISQEKIERFRGSSTGDFLSGVPGVLNAENRNSGALDVNIRGMQGQGRVPVVIDGAMQESTVYRGYAGMAGRTYLDPALIGGVTIEKGPSAAADGTGATGGLLRARTLSAGDIVAPGGSWGLVVRGGLSGNNGKPPTKVTVGGSEPAVRKFDRPDTFDLNGRNASIAGAYRTERYDLVAAYATRKNGNYYSGSQGISPDAWKGGANRFSYEEQVINSSQDNTSYLLRGVFRPTTAHTIDLSYMRYETKFGEMKPSQLMYGDTPYQTNSDVKVDTYTARYRYKPEGNLVDFRADLWASRVDSFVIDPVRFDFGGGDIYNSDKFAATLSNRRGLTVSNTSRFSGTAGALALAYGGAYDFEKFGKSKDWDELNERYPGAAWDTTLDGWRRQYSAFVSAEYKPAPWATFTAATRYVETVVQDHKTGTSWVQGGLQNRDKASGWAPIISVVVEPIAGLQTYARYAEAFRAPSPFEGTEGFSGSTNPYSSLRPEHAHNTEVGVNYQRLGLFTGDDLLQVKAGWFRNDVTDYITLGSETLTAPNGNYTDILVRTNIPRVTTQGVELSARYDMGLAYVELAGTEYTEVTSCYRQVPQQAVRCYDGMPQTSQSWFVNHVPPKRTMSATVGARLMDENLQLGGRYVKVERQPAYETVDLFGSYRFSDKATFTLTVDNVFDRYYVDALTLGEGAGILPAPGRTVRIGLVSRFGDGERPAASSALDRVRGYASGALAQSPLQDFDGDWSGFYAGADWGWKFMRAKGNTRTGDGSASAVASTERTDRQVETPLAGLHFGYNRQLPSGLVVGVEVDGELTRGRGKKGFVSTELDTGRYDGPEILQAEYAYRYDGGGSARLRVGQAVGRALYYGTGGLGLIREEQTRTQFRSTSASAAYPFGFTTRPYFTEKDDKTRAGLVLGGGAELAFNDRVSLRGEYLYGYYPSTSFRFDRASQNVNRSYTSGGVTTPGGIDVAVGRDAKNRLETHSLRIGLNYSF